MSAGTMEKNWDVMTTPGFSRDTVDALSDVLGDGEWMKNRRAAAWEFFSEAPMPTNRDENWRFNNLRGFSFDKIVPSSGADGMEAAVDATQTSIAVPGETAARFVHVNGCPVASRFDAPALPEGVIVGDLLEMLEAHPELVQKYWGAAVPSSSKVDDKFVALQEATVCAGVFVFVPRNVRVDLPILSQHVNAVNGGTVNRRVLIVLEECAEATFVEEFTSLEADFTGFSNVVVELIVGKAARLNYVTLQDYAHGVDHFATHRLLAQRDSNVEWTAVGLGGSRGKSRMEVRLVGPGSSVKLSGLYFGDGTQEIDYDTQQFHEAPNAFSDLSFRGALTDRSKAVWRGMIDVAEGAQGTDSYQENRNLILSKKAHADSIPGLQIEANEVRCTHGSTTSKVDAEQLFYLQSRGMTREESIKTIVRGFFVPALDRIANVATRDAVREVLYARMDDF